MRLLLCVMVTVGSLCEVTYSYDRFACFIPQELAFLHNWSCMRMQSPIRQFRDGLFFALCGGKPGRIRPDMRLLERLRGRRNFRGNVAWYPVQAYTVVMTENAKPEVGERIYISSNGRAIHRDAHCSIAKASWHTDENLSIIMNPKWAAALEAGKVHVCKKCW